MSRRGTDWYSVFWIVALVLFLIVVFAWVVINNANVDQQIEDCIADGGTPIVVSSRSLDEFKACAP